VNPTLQKLYSIFGQAVFIPVGLGSKKPTGTGWHKVTFAESRQAAYQAELEQAVSRGGNIGVALGPLSDGLMSIDIDEDSHVDQFLKLNPALGNTTRTRGKRGCQFFIRLIPGCFYPNTKAVYNLKDTNAKKYGEWRCGGGGFGAQSVVFGVHPDGMAYQFLVERPPLVIDWNTLQWLGSWASPSSGQPPHPPRAAATPPVNLQQVYNDLFTAFGDPFVKTQRSFTINQPFFARLWGFKRLAFYERTAEDFYAYNQLNGLFERLRSEEVKGLIRSDLIAEGSSRGFQTIATKINSGLLDSILALIKADEQVCKTNFFAFDLLAPPVIHAANGMLCIEGDRVVLRDFDPLYRSRNQIPIDYVTGASCVHYITDLLEPILNAEDRDLLQRYCGLILIGGNRAQKILMMLGGGGTSKGTITRLIALVIGRRNILQLRVDQLTGRFETARLVGKLLLNVVEATANYLNRDGAEVVKALCGHDPMEGEKKYQTDPISFDGTFPIIVTSNEAVNVRLAGDETAQARRIAIIQFPDARPADAPVIDHYEQVLYDEESEGIFAWMIEGVLKHWKELQQKKGFQLSAAQKKRVDELIGRSKSIETFVTTQLEEWPTADVTTEELYDGYCAFCAANNWMPFVEQRFEEQSRYLILRTFNITKRTDIQRPNAKGKMTNRRGYSELRIK
jgi:P4 family phage/plasmid primase-like protien